MPDSDLEHVPSWIHDSAVLTAGIDLLALRLPVQLIGGDLLDGITTVTPHVRYLSLRAWLVHRYGQTGRADSSAAFTEFCLRVEAGVAIGALTNDRKLVGMVGGDQAGVRADSADAAIGVSPLVVTPAAVIYASASDQLAISWDRGDGTPGLTSDRGVPLAMCVQSQLQDLPGLETLVDLDEPAVDRVVLAELGARVRIDVVPDRERQLLVDALLPAAPFPREVPRMGTCAAILLLAQRSRAAPSEMDFLLAACAEHGFQEPRLQATADGWLMYCIRDALAVSQEATLAAVMDELSSRPDGGRAGVQRHELLAALIDDVERHDAPLRDLGALGPDESVGNLSFRDVHALVEQRLASGTIAGHGIARWSSPFVEPRLFRVALQSGVGALSVAVVAWMVGVLRVGSGSRAAAALDGALSSQGTFRMGMREVVLPLFETMWREDRLFLQAAAELAQRTVQQHLQTAWSRMDNNLLTDVALLHAEGSLWFGRGAKFAAGRTGSRLPQLTGWLRQLQLVDPKGTTAHGDAVLARALNAMQVPES